MRPSPFLLTALLAALVPLPSPAAPAPEATPGLAALRRAQARFAPVELGVDLSRLPASERSALAKLVEAARVMDTLFLRQVWPGNEPLLLQLLADRSPLGRARLDAFLAFKGPWDRLEAARPLVPGAPEKPAQAGFYPADATREEVERWAAGLSGDAKDDALGFFTVVRRRPDGALTAVPYSLEYQGELARAAALLRGAAAATRDDSLRAFLEARARAFLTNAYRDSDAAWMAVDGALEATVGPYEVYEDGWFNAKAAFEAIVGVRDDAATAQLSRLSAELQGIEDALPIDPALRNPHLGALAPIRVVDVVFMAGDAAQGVQLAAYNLPNDEWVTAHLGSKRVMLKNMQEAKYRRVLVPIARVALSPVDRRRIAFDAFFTHILMHELVHGLGPHEVQPAGAGQEATTVRAALADAYSALEEAKADVGGLFALQRLVRQGKLDRALGRSLYPTYLADAFRAVRFGLSEAHGKGMALQLNWFLDHGGLTVRRDGTFAIDEPRLEAAVASLTGEIMTIQARGDRAAAQALLDGLGVIRPEVQRVLDRLRDVPVDVAPRYVTAVALAPR